jgi:SAM-dependent methyltransferase
MNESSPMVFDRTAVRRHRDRAADGLSDYDFLLSEVGERLADRLDDVKRSFPLALDLGCHAGTLAATVGERGGIETLVQCDASARMARAATRVDSDIAAHPALVADEEFLPFAERTFDLVLSSMSLHWANDLPGVLLQINNALKPDGLFLGAMLGGETLYELRQSLLMAESELEGGAGPRVSPFAQVQDAAALLQRAGFALPVTDVDTITVGYPDALKLMDDLRGMGQSNAVRDRRKSWSRRETLLYAAELYHETYGDDEGRIPATFQIIYFTAWRPAADQPQPPRPGAAKRRLADAPDPTEHSAGDKARPSGSG